MYQHDPVAKKAISRYNTQIQSVCNVLLENLSLKLSLKLLVKRDLMIK